MGELGDITGLRFSSSSGYTIVDEIGRGGMGIVFLAEKNCEGVTDYVALKTIKTQSPDHLAKLKKEANIATGLRHENIVKTYGLEAIPFAELPDELVREIEEERSGTIRRERIPSVVPGRRLSGSAAAKAFLRQQAGAGKADDRKLYLMVMDYIEGTDLGTLHKTHVKRNLLIPCMLGAFIISRVARALAYAHAFLVHRDISPENVLLNTQGVVKLSDFGIAVTDPSQSQVLAGKFLYMSPEQFRREPLDARTDLFSLGLVLYELLTGISPHRMPAGLTREQTEKQLAMTLQREIPAPVGVRTDVPQILSDICMKMLEKERARRYPRALDVANHLEQKYLYARGFGPTNNALAAYWEIFGTDFANPTNDQLKQLSFLKDESGAFTLKRPVAANLYTKMGRDWINYLTGKS
jgi:serine/threonine protein kinase